VAIVLLDGWVFGSTSTSGDPSLTTSYTVSSGSDRILLVHVGLGYNGPTVTGVTFGGAALTALGTAATNGVYARAEIWYLLNPTAGTANIVTTFSAACRACHGIGTYSGVHQSATWGTPGTSTGYSSTSRSVTLTSATGELCLDVIAMETQATPGTLTITGGQTSRINQNGTGAANVTLGISELAGAASTVMSWTTTSGHVQAMLAVPMKPADVAAATKAPLWILSPGY
jgi:hypothetical protein